MLSKIPATTIRQTGFSVSSTLRSCICGLCLVAASLMLTACQPENEREAHAGTEADSWQQIRDQGSGTLHVLYVPSGGFAYTDDDGKLTGAVIEIFRSFKSWAEETYGVELELAFEPESNWSRFYNRVADAGDGLVGTGNVTITEPRREVVQFSPPYLDNISVLVSHEARPVLTSMDDIPEVFAGRTGLMHTGTLNKDRMVQIRDGYFPEMDTLTVHSNEEIMALMSEGDRYFTYLDVHNFVHGLSDGIPMKRHEIADDANEQFGFIMPLNSDWIDPITSFFEHAGGFVNSDDYREIMRKHLGEGMMDVLGD